MNPAAAAAPIRVGQRHAVEEYPRTAAQPASTMKNVIGTSGMFERDIATMTGVNASSTPLTRPAARPATRRTVDINSHTEAPPSSTVGSMSDHGWNPNTRVDNAASHNESGGLSTVTHPPASTDAYQKACQLVPIERTAAA
jgi:hypothetical protein